MIEKFLKAKHWQLFFLIFGLKIIFDFGFMRIIFTDIGNQSDSTFLENYTKYSPLLIIPSMGIYIGWIWAVVIGLHDKINKYTNFDLERFKFLLFIPIIHFLFNIAFFDPNTISTDGPIYLSFFLNLVSMLCLFHSLYFVAKTFKTVELQRKVNFFDFASEFFLILLYPIGIWIIQPKINILAKKD